MAVLKVKRISDRATMPKYAYDGDMCFDVAVLIDDESNIPSDMTWTDKYGTRIEGNCGVVTIRPRETVLFHTGLVFETDTGYGVKCHVRSSVGIRKHLVLANATGIIDTATYRGEFKVALTNVGGDSSFVFDGDRVVQCEVVPVVKATIVETNIVSDTKRGVGGIGSTGNG